MNIQHTHVLLRPWLKRIHCCAQISALFLILGVLAAVTGCIAGRSEVPNFQALKHRVINSPRAEQRELVALFAIAEDEMAKLGHTRISSPDPQDITSCRRLQAALIDLQKELGPTVGLCVLSGTGGMEFVREAAYRCLLNYGMKYTVQDIHLLSDVLLMTHKGELLGWSREETGGFLADFGMRKRLSRIVVRVLRLSPKDLPEGAGPYGSRSVQDTKDWLRQVLTTALDLPANAKDKTVIADTLADLKP